MTTTAPLRLPIPSLADTCQRYLHQVRPLLSDEEYARTESAVGEFLDGVGPTLQEALQGFDAAPDRQDESWLIGAWLESYLSGRTPPPLSTSISIAIPMHGHDLAGWLAAFARVCADHHHGRIPVPQAPGGTPHCMNQWRILQGASRLAFPQIDGYTINEHGSRHIGVLHNGYYTRLLALDESHEALPAEHFREALAQIRRDPASNPFPVAVPCYLGSETTSHVLNVLDQIHEDNRRLLDDIRNDLFHICLRSTPEDEDTELASTTFLGPQDVWCYKPFSLIHNDSTQRLHMHCEHTHEDGGTLRGIIERARNLLRSSEGVDDEQAAGDPAARSHAAAQDGSGLPRRAWHLDAELERKWPAWQADHARQAGVLRIRSVLVAADTARVPRGISHDALMQFLMQYAQQATWGKVRNTYEAVDASHFQRGRTECVRPVSTESLAFVQGLLQDSPSEENFRAALLEHKTRIKLCKQGQGPNRHLLGLQLTAAREGMTMPALFQDHGYQVFSTDFLSTSTLGTDDIIRGFGFAPTSAGGLGVNYTLSQKGWQFIVCHHQDQAADVATFIGHLQTGGARLLRFLERLG